MLGIGFKISDTPINAIKRPLIEYMQREYAPNAELSTVQQDALEKFLALKSDVDLVRTPSTISRLVLLRYYGQLDRFASRFANSNDAAKDATKTPPLKLPFTWNDSFCPRKKSSDSSIKFEQTAVMFNYGALESQLGVQTDRSSAEGLKAACRHFMLAAGAFSVVKDELVGQWLSARTPDTTAEGLGLLTYLMLAQAQACFYEKAIKDQMKDAIKAKLVHQALEYYTTALEFVNSSALSGTIDRSWGTHLLFQVFCMKAATQYWQAKAAKEIALTRGVGYGEEIARLLAAQVECQEATKVATQNKLPASLLQSVQALHRVIQEQLQIAQKDNASVYLEKVPKFGELPAIGKASMVKPLVLTTDEIAQEMNGVDLFEQFVPSTLLNRADAVKKEIIELLASTTEKVSKTNEEAKQKLHDMGLPAAIEAFEQTNDNGIPQVIWQKILYIQTTNGLAQTGRFVIEGENPVSAMISQRLQENRRASEAAEKKLHGIETRLAEEEVEDNVCRQNYGSTKWSRPLSSSLNQNFRLDIDRYYRLVKEAKQSDDDVTEKMRMNKNLLAHLSETKADLDHQLPILQQETSSCSEEIAQVSSLLLHLGHLVEEKDQLLHDFNVSSEKFNALPVLLAGNQGGTDTDAALETEKRFFREHFVGKLDAICVDEQALLGELEIANGRFEAKKANDDVMLSRQAFLQRLSDAVDAFEQLESHIKEGKTFYDELNSRIGQLSQTVEDHIAARELEKREMELRITTDEATKKREAEDAVLAQQMMSNVRLNERPPINNTDDEAFARQLAGNTPQHYQSSPMEAPPSYNYAVLQSQQHKSEGLRGYAPPSQHPYTQYQQSQNGGASAPYPPPPSYGDSNYHSSAVQFGNYYNQQQHQQPSPQQPHQQPSPQQQQPPHLPPSYGSYQYPAYQQQFNANSTTNYSRNPPRDSV